MLMWAVNDGDPQERTEIVWARSKEAALRIGWRVFKGDWSRQDYSEVIMDGHQVFECAPGFTQSARRLGWLRTFYATYAPAREKQEGRDRVLRLAGLHWAGEPVCYCCNLGETGTQTDPEEWRVCSECDQCGECGHDDECIEARAQELAP